MLSTHVADALNADAMVLAKAAQILGKDIFREKYTYTLYMVEHLVIAMYLNLCLRW